MTTDGRILLAVVTALWGEDTREAIAVPALADLQYELAQNSGTAINRAWLTLRGLVGLASALVRYTVRLDGTLVRFSAPSLLTTLSVAALDATMTLASTPNAAPTLNLWLLLLPSTLSTGLTVGLGVGIAQLHSRRRRGPQARRALAGTLLLATILIGVAVNHTIPDSNQRFREHVYSALDRPPARGANELSWEQLVEAVASGPSRRSIEATPANPPAVFWLAARLEVTLAPVSLLLLLLATKRRDADDITRLVFLAGAMVYFAWHLFMPPTIIAGAIHHSAAPWLVAAIPLLLTSTMAVLVAARSRSRNSIAGR